MTAAYEIGFLVYPDMTLLDAAGPAQVLAALPGARVHMIAKSLAPVPTDAAFPIVPTTTFDACPPLDVVCVGGGAGQVALMEDAETLDFLRRQAAGAKYVTSVCTGSLILGAAGLIDGYRSACHWAFRELLPTFGATPVDARVVRDRNRMSGGGVTAGIDFALTLAAELAGEEAAKELQLLFEYAPAPPFDAGTPERAGPALAAKLRARFAQTTPEAKTDAAEENA